MPSFNQQQLAYRAQNGNTVTVMIGDEPIAFAQNVSHSFELGTESLYGVGSAKPQEIQQLRVQPTITLNNFALTALGEQLVQEGVPLPFIIANNQFNISIVDGLTGAVRFTYVGAVASNFSESIPSNQVLTQDVSFLCMDVLGPQGTSLLDGPNAYSVPSTAGAVVNGGLGISVAS